MRKRASKKPTTHEAPADHPEVAVPPAEAAPPKDPAAVSLGRRGGLKGGKARAAKLTKQQRVAIAKKAAQARWAKPK
ncbi:MAG TPA: hypothetical protein VG013_05935 [Gemmataceae bacterium]|jgi:hypothetical protein|nr:hypothetical protein [Gemmataceae bacterium]